MANGKEEFADVLDEYRVRRKYSGNQLADLAEIPRQTVKNWLNGRVKKPQGWQPIIKVAVTLNLNEREANRLLKAGGWNSMIKELREIVNNPTDAGLLAHWFKEVPIRGDFGLPTKVIPALAPLPPSSLMPYSPNPLFVGREEELKGLARVLNGSQTAAIGQIVASTGLGGIGKTQLAVEFVHRYGQYFNGGVFWLSFADATGVGAEVAACGGPGGLGLYTEHSGLTLKEQVAKVQQEWQSPVPRLLVFDNCEEEALLAEWRPKSGHCRVVMTSRRGWWDIALGVQALRLEVLPRPKSIELLRKFRPDLGKNDPELDAIADELGDLPLALHLAGSFLKAYKGETTPDEYLAELQGEAVLGHESLQGMDLSYSPTNHELHVRRTFTLSYERLRAEDPIDALAMSLLGRAAYFGSGEPIPRELLWLTVELPDKATRRKAVRALKRLVGLGLLDEEREGVLRLHRLLAAFVQEVTSGEEAQAKVEETVLGEAQRLNEAGYPGPLLALQSHLRTVTERALEQEKEVAASLCTSLGYHLQMVGDYEAAWPYYERALAIQEKVLGPEHPDTALSLNNLAALLKDQGNHEGAWPYYERALAIREKVLGPEHPDTAVSLNNLASLLHAQGSYAGAQPYYERALAIREKVLGPEHPDTAGSLNNLALLLHAQGDYAGAQPYFERALMIWEKVLGPEHPNTISGLNNLALLLYAQGNYAGAHPYFERALAIREKVLGPEHPHTALSLNNLAALLYAQGNYTGARPYYDRALAIREKVLGPEHPHTATSLNNLATLLKAQGDYAGAQPYFERALMIWEKVLGPEHPNTALNLNNLAALLKSQGNYAEARLYYERALMIQEKVLGPEHPDTALSLNNLATLLKAQRDYAGARPYYERALAIWEKVLGPEHPTTRTVRNNLASLSPESPQ